MDPARPAVVLAWMQDNAAFIAYDAPFKLYITAYGRANLDVFQVASTALGFETTTSTRDDTFRKPFSPTASQELREIPGSGQYAEIETMRSHQSLPPSEQYIETSKKHDEQMEKQVEQTMMRIDQMERRMDRLEKQMKMDEDLITISKQDRN
ncbi:MAG: hypothetical protein Q9162_007784 [Coniocarpon cinnabarinum]